MPDETDPETAAWYRKERAADLRAIKAGEKRLNESDARRRVSDQTDREEPRVTTEAARLSKLLWDARENLDMWADVVESRTGRPADSVRRLVAEIDEYRAEHGWNPHGFGREQ